MITENTVFILGAGASCPYGYPDGSKLREEICSQFVNDTEAYIQSHEEIAGAAERNFRFKAREFQRLFYNSSTKSIDLFLARNPELMEMGKAAIIFRILDAERHSNFREDTPTRNQDWYSYLFDKLTDELVTKDDYKRFNENQVSFITFNYDRSLEYFLSDSLVNSFIGIKAVEIQEQLRQIKIIHIFGQVAGLEWQQQKVTLPYKPVESSIDTGQLIDNLKIIYEKNDNPELDEARKLIGEVPRIFFLGFGFAKENLEILKIPEILNKTQKVFGTALGFTEKEIKDIRNIFPSEDAFIGGLYEKNNIKIHDMDCLELLREYL